MQSSLALCTARAVVERAAELRVRHDHHARRGALQAASSSCSSRTALSGQQACSSVCEEPTASKDAGESGTACRGAKASSTSKPTWRASATFGGLSSTPTTAVKPMSRRTRSPTPSPHAMSSTDHGVGKAAKTSARKRCCARIQGAFSDSNVLYCLQLLVVGVHRHERREGGQRYHRHASAGPDRGAV
eukprot:564229-Rhodomonas_salina.1